MKIIDLLNKIAKGEEVPKKIKYGNDILFYDGEDNESNNYNATFNYYDKNDSNGLFNGYIGKILDVEVEIIDEDRKIEYVNTYVLCDSDFSRKGEYSLKATEIIDTAFEEYSNKINELIDEIKELKENK